MSERNPNVFYELGIGHAIGRPAILLSRDAGDIPFDLRHIRHIVYNTDDATWKERLQENIQNCALSVLHSPTLYPQPLLTEKPFLVKQNAYEARQYIIDFLTKNPQMQVDMLEYSTATATDLLHVLRQTECTIRLLAQHPRTACSSFQRDRISASIKDLCIRALRDYRNAEIRFYCTPGSLRARNFGDRLLNFSWYTYECSQQGVNIHGDTNSQIILRTEGSRGQILLNMFRQTFERLWNSEATVKPGPMPWTWPLKIPSPKLRSLRESSS